MTFLSGSSSTKKKERDASITDGDVRSLFVSEVNVHEEKEEEEEEVRKHR
jgi:hypothetical protein